MANVSTRSTRTSIARSVTHAGYANADGTENALINGVIAFTVALQAIFIGVTGTMGVVAMLATLGLVAVTQWRAFITHMIANPLPHVFWLLALASVLWSVEPALTLRYSTQLALSIFLGMLMTGFGRGTGALHGVALAFPIFLGLSVLKGQSVAMGAQGGTAFAGLTGSKNLLAGSAASAVLALTAAAASSFEAQKVARALCLVGAAVGAFAIMLMARSSGALLTTSIICPVMLAMIFLRHAPMSTRSTIVIVLLLFATVFLIFSEEITRFVTDLVLTTFNKDSRLTGRAELWDIADKLVRERPWLGVGYGAFWVQGHVDAEGIWRMAGIAGRMGFNFHSTFREILVHFGWIGFIILAGSLATCLLLFVRLFILGASIAQLYWLSFIAYVLFSVGWESFLPTPFNTATFFIAGAFTAACSSVDAPSTSSRYRRRPRHRSYDEAAIAHGAAAGPRTD